MTISHSELLDAIDLLNEARQMAEAAFLACDGLQIKQEGNAMRAIVGAYADRTKDALEMLEAAHERGRSA